MTTQLRMDESQVIGDSLWFVEASQTRGIMD